MKQLLIFFGVMRVLTLGFLGSLGTATAASGLAWAARKYPNFIPKQVRSSRETLVPKETHVGGLACVIPSLALS